MNKPIASLILLPLIFTSCASGSSSAVQNAVNGEPLDLHYAEQFTAEKRPDGCFSIVIGEDSFILVPENIPEPQNTNGATVIHQPVRDIYLASSSVMNLFCGLNALDNVTMTSTDIQNWTLPDVQSAMDTGELTYIGKYNAPDYEALVENDCGIAIENTMIYHSPDTKEQIQQLGIPVMVERSSYESHPLGRLEWIKLYGLLLGEYEKAEEFFTQKENIFNSVDITDIPEDERPTAAFFFISPNGYVNVRKPNDYIARMIELAGGKYVLDAETLSVDENSLSTMNIQFETFYDTAKDADFLIYNSTVDGSMDTIEQLLEKNSLLADFKAVKNGNVWCTEMNMFQQTTGAAEMVLDINRILTGNTEGSDSLTYLHRLK